MRTNKKEKIEGETQGELRGKPQEAQEKLLVKLVQRVRMMIKYRKQVHLPGHHEKGKERGDAGPSTDLEDAKKSIQTALLVAIRPIK